MATGITVDVSRRICGHMNDDHAITVYGMVQYYMPKPERGGKVNEARMESVSLKDYLVSYVLCKGNECSKKILTIPFKPVLCSAKEAKGRIIDEHKKVLDAQFSWLFLDPVAFLVVIIFISLGLVHGLGTEGVENIVEKNEIIDFMISSMFTSVATFSTFATRAWYFLVVAHLFEGSYTAYRCKKTLKVSALSTLKWFVVTFMVGRPILLRINKLVAVDRESRIKREAQKES